MNEYQSSKLKELELTLRELNTFKRYKFDLLIDNVDIHMSSIVLTTNKNIHVWYDTYRKRYHFVSRKHHAYVSEYERHEIEERYNRPQNVGVLSARKIKDWIEYLEAIDNDMNAKSIANTKKIDKFLECARGYGIQVIESTYSPSEYRGRAIKNGIGYSFTIDRTGYIKQEMDISYSVSRSINSWFALSENKYRGESD